MRFQRLPPLRIGVEEFDHGLVLGGFGGGLAVVLHKAPRAPLGPGACGREDRSQGAAVGLPAG